MAGAASSACFYVPVSEVKKWSWETTWIVAGMFSWILLPVGVSFLLLLPDFVAFYSSLDSTVVLKAFLAGCMWGIGNVNYGLIMRYLGMSLGIGVAMGVTLMVGTLFPPLLHVQFFFLFTTRSGIFTVAGVLLSLIGVVTVAAAGRKNEQRLNKCAEQFNLRKGLLLALLCGVFSSGMSFAIDCAEPVKAAALNAGVKPLYAGLPVYVIIMGGGVLVNLVYCLIRLATRKELSIRNDISLSLSTLVSNGGLAAAGGIVWYFQFFFYAWGAANLPQHLFFVNWMLLMSGCVFFGGLVGLLLGGWRGSGVKPVRLLWTGMTVIILATNIVGIGMAL